MKPVAPYIKKVGQLYPADTNAHTLCKPAYKGTCLYVNTVITTNLSVNSKTFKIFHGTPGNYQDNHILTSESLPTGEHHIEVYDPPIPVHYGEGFGVSASAASCIVFTAFGKVVDVGNDFVLGAGL